MKILLKISNRSRKKKKGNISRLETKRDPKATKGRKTKREVRKLYSFLDDFFSDIDNILKLNFFNFFGFLIIFLLITNLTIPEVLPL